VVVTQDPGILALEGEKNHDEDNAAIQAALRSAYKKKWSDPRSALFQLVSIETQAGCNASCGFCPVSRATDPRPSGVLPMDVMERIAANLADLEYSGRVALFGNNEPLLDSRIVDKVRMFRKRLRGVDLRLLSNGTLADVRRVRDLFEAGLTTLTLNNYTDGRSLIRPVRDLLASAELFVDHDVRVSVRRRDEVLTTRAGLAPNKLAPARPPPMAFVHYRSATCIFRTPGSSIPAASTPMGACPSVELAIAALRQSGSMRD